MTIPFKLCIKNTSLGKSKNKGGLELNGTNLPDVCVDNVNLWAKT